MSALHNRLKKNEFFKPEAFIDGVWIDTGKTFPVFNPATGEKLADMAYCGRNQTEVAIEAAHKAFQSWRKTNGHRTRNHPEPLVCPHHGNRPFLGRTHDRPNRASPCRKRWAKSITPPVSSSGSPKKHGAPTGKSFHPSSRIHAFLRPVSRSASWPRSRPGTSRWRC